MFKLIIAAALACFFTVEVYATDLVYGPNNPSFGGNPSNGIVLLNQAQATNKHKEAIPVSPSSSSLSSQQSALKQFNDMLSRSILGQLASAATSSVIGTNGKLSPGAVETGNFKINIVDLGGGKIQITTTDKTSGESTEFVVSQATSP